jgi:hypothetical protein
MVGVIDCEVETAVDEPEAVQISTQRPVDLLGDPDGRRTSGPW